MGAFKKLSQQMAEARRSRKLLTHGLPFELSLESLSESSRFERAQDPERLAQFNSEVQAWSIHATSLLRNNVRMLVDKDRALSASIVPNLYYDRKYAKEARRIGFSFRREGIYLHKGAGRGQGGSLGSQWTDAYGQLKRMNPQSAGKMGTGRRLPVPWFNPVIEKELPFLADIVGRYAAELQIDATRIFITG